MPLTANAINQILPFAPEALEEAGDLLPLAEYKTETMRKRGFRSGLARRSLFNRAHRQSAHMASGLAQFIANRYAPGVVDDADLDKVEEGLRHSIQAMIDAGAIDVSEFAPKSRKINTSAPLTGGGDLSADRTLGINAVAAPTASAVVLRDSAGRAQVAAPSAAADIARKDTVDAVSTSLTTHAALTTAHGSTSAATASAIIQRDASGRAQVAAPSAAADIARKADVDAVAARTITVSAPLTGGGDLTANRTLGVTFGTAANTICQGNDARLQYTQSLAASGWCKLPNGLIFQWGLGTIPAGQYAITLTLPLAFPSACFIAIPVDLNPTSYGAMDTSMQTISVSKTQIQFYSQGMYGNTSIYPVNLYWFAIGN